MAEPDDVAGHPADEHDAEHMEKERGELREFIKSLDPETIRSGNWFEKLISHALSTYTHTVDWKYFQDRYAGVPADAIVDQRIKIAERYAALEGGASAGAYTGAIVATLGSGGGASPVTLPAAALTILADVAFTTQLQLRLAWDIGVLYGVALDTDDPEDLWKLLRVAFSIKSGEGIREGVLKAAPAVIRPLIKKFYSGAVLSAARGLPVVGKFLLQRNVIKVGIPLIGVPLAVVLNRYTTLIAGRHAQAVFRNEARVIEAAESLSRKSKHPQLALWVAWLVIVADQKIADDEALLMRHLTRAVSEHHDVVDDELAQLVDVDPNDVWGRLEDANDDLSDLVDVATRVASIDGPINRSERAVIVELEARFA